MVRELSENQTTLFSDNPEYDAFVEKFKRKKTTDDCYTPENVYNAVADWVAEEYRLDRACFVRPFWPDGDYQAFEYPPECVVVDNPPFSIYTQILRWYQAHNVRFFLFAPALTLFGGKGGVDGVCYLTTAVDVTYANGANVRTSFATNLDRYKIRTAPDLWEAVDAANRTANPSRAFPKYAYPNYVISAAVVQKLARSGTDFRVLPEDCIPVNNLDDMKAHGKWLFGGGFLLSERAAQDYETANRKHLNHMSARGSGHMWKLSDREREIIRRLGERS